MESMDPQLWLVAIVGAFALGLSKGGIVGLNNITIALFALIFPPKLSVGIILLLLIVGDWGAFYYYRRHAVWKYVLPTIPWALGGVVVGWIFLDRLEGEQVGRLIGSCLIVLIALHLARKYLFKSDYREWKVPHAWWFIGLAGLLAGFTSTVANAAAPIMLLFFLALGLPKLEFLGTGAWFFMFLNLIKIPFYWSIDLLSVDTLILDLKLAPVVIIGVIVGRSVVLKIPQKGFEWFALLVTLLASLKLIF